MATTVEELEVLIKANTASLKSGLDQVRKQMGVLQKATNSASKGMSVGMVAAGTVIGQIATKVIGAAFNAIAGEMDSAITRLDTLNNYSRVMSNLGISSEDAEKSISVLNEGILGLPTSLDAAAQATQRLTAVNGNIAASTDMFLALNNAILAGGASTQLQETALEQLTQAYSKGKADAMEWRAMLSAMPAQMNQVAKAMGYTSAALGGDLQTALVNGEASMNDFMFTIMKLNKEGVDGFQSFAEQAKNATGGVQTSISNMKISIQRALANIGDAIGQSNIAGFFNKIASVIDTVGVYIAGFVKVIKEAVAWVSVLFGGSGSTGGLVKATNSAAKNTSSIATGASDTASGLNDATSAAKKLKGQLAGFDEMNVLTEKDTSSSGGSSSGSGGGSTTITDYDWNSDGLTDGIDKVAEAAERLKKIFSDIFGDFDLDKIGKAFKQFKKDIEKFLKPVKQILKDVWEDYLQPFLEWSGNSLLPSVLNAIGGALSFVGSVLSTTWNTFLKPFVDAFLVPIAKFTGGVIVSVLNGIGDALRWIGDNEWAVDAVSIGLVSLGSAIAGVKIAGFVDQFKLAIDIFSKTQAAGLTLHTSFGAIASGTTGLTSTISGALASVGTGISSFIASLGAILLPLELAAAAVAAVRVAIEFLNLKMAEGNLAQASAKTYENERLKSLDALNKSLELSTYYQDELNRLTNETTDYSLQLLNAQENLKTKQSELDSVARQYGMTTEQVKQYVNGLDITTGNLSAQDMALAKAVNELSSANQKVSALTEKVKTLKEDEKNATESLNGAILGELTAKKKAEAQELIVQGKYEETIDLLKDLGSNYTEYTNSQGQSTTISKEQAENMVDFIADQLGKLDEENSKTWKNYYATIQSETDNAGIVEKLDSLYDKVKEAGDLTEAGKQSAYSLADGTVIGLQNKASVFYNAGWQAGKQVDKGFRDAEGIKSPSRVFKKLGGYLGEGAAIGVEQRLSDLYDAGAELGTAGANGFEGGFEQLSDIVHEKMKGFSLPDINTLKFDVDSSAFKLAQQKLASIEANAQTTVVETIEASSAQQITVNIGDEKLIDKVVDGINQVSRLKNRAVINC